MTYQDFLGGQGYVSAVAMATAAVTPKKDHEEAAERFDYIRFTFADFHGIGRSKSVARRNFKEFFDNGITVYAGVHCFGPRGEIEFVPEEAHLLALGNATAKPMSGTLHALPWATNGQHRVGEVLCETFWIPPFRGGAQQDACPRYVARRQLDRLTQLGYQLYSGFEAEFIVFDSNSKPVFTGHDMFVNTLFSEFESFIYSMDDKMAAAGVDVATLHSEYGDGQFEMALAPKYGIEAADQMFILKGAVKEMSNQKNGWQATFMSKPFTDTAGNGLHFSHSLWSLATKENVFYDPNSTDSFSAVARYWMAGIIRHGPALMALCSPTVNCYRRVGTPLTPSYIDWGIGDRSAAVCAKTASPSTTYFENRLPGGAANPYLVIAATVAAGIDGIINKLECPAPVTRNERNAVEENPSSSVLQRFPKIPKTLAEALEALENDTVLGEALGKEFVYWFVNSKRSNEVKKVFKLVECGEIELDVERKMYFKFL